MLVMDSIFFLFFYFVDNDDKYGIIEDFCTTIIFIFETGDGGVQQRCSRLSI